ncbi:DUF1178 family protein [Roseovarius spongiae]|uniref:DUF1178 family protein n=1 Tax=Roseovarius spongiae TaxID=2320272 RepID=A0A3A8AXV8_9RHOB|nr:DUF1178 family protein [Roseovarius spongiae]RKF16616.1 DUF1178 family protein [Roseovarius spongiae]
MIKFTLKCAEGHRFESWFQDSAAFDKLDAAGMIACSVCGDAQVEKAIMAPAVSAGRKGAAPAREDAPLSAPASPAEQALAELRRRVERESEYVGMSFAQEARDIHEGAAPERAIHGEARAEDAKKLIEDGVPVAPLPFRLGRKSN